MPQLLAIAEYITKTLAICVVCGDPANHTQRLVASSDRVLVGASGTLRGALPALFRPDAGDGRKAWSLAIKGGRGGEEIGGFACVHRVPGVKSSFTSLLLVIHFTRGVSRF